MQETPQQKEKRISEAQKSHNCASRHRVIPDAVAYRTNMQIALEISRASALDSEQVSALLTALGDWGVAEEKGESQQKLATFAGRALSALRTVQKAA